MSLRRRMAVSAVAALVVSAPSSAGAAVVVGPGALPGLAVDAAGTAYVAWSGPGNPQPLSFCRLPRGASACDPAAASTIATPGATIRRPFIAVSGDRVVVVQSRYGGDIPGFRAVLAFTSTDRGATFGPAKVVGDVVMNEAVIGPGDTLSGVTNAESGGTQFQNVPIDGSAPTDAGGASMTGEAVLSTDHPYNASVGFIDASTPLAVFTDGSDRAQFRRYTGSGGLNDVANWTGAVDIGTVRHPKLAGGPAGLFMLGTTDVNDVFVRRWDGTTFAPPVSLGTKDEPPGQHLFQDAAGRLHAVFARGEADGLHLVHAVSDDGAAWRLGTVETQSVAQAGGMGDLRVATAADHIGVAAWSAGAGAPDVRVAAVGPDAPVDPQPPPAARPAPTLTAPTGAARRVGRRFVLRLTARIVPPAGVTEAAACRGSVAMTVRRATRRIASRTVTVRSDCGYTVTVRIKAAKVRRARRLRVRLAFSGNDVLAPSTTNRSVKVRR